VSYALWAASFELPAASFELTLQGGWVEFMFALVRVGRDLTELRFENGPPKLGPECDCGV